MLENNAKTTFSNLSWHKLNIELGEWGVKKRNLIQHRFYHKDIRILCRGDSLNQLWPRLYFRFSPVITMNQ
jgi:hypothetical protein